MTVMDNEDPADPSAHEPRVTGAPETVWLVYGDLEHDDTHANCCASGEVTWCEDAQFSADVRYLRADLLYTEAREIAAQLVAAERERCARICDEARAAIWPYHEPEVLNAACTVCENLANRIRGIGA